MKLAFFSPCPSDTCSFYRGVGPYSKLPGVDLTILTGQAVDWAVLSQFDILVMQRPFTSDHLELLKLAKQQMPVIVDYDDLLFEVPLSNPCYELFAHQHTRETMQEIIGRANAVTVSTPELASSLQLYNIAREYVVIPNAWDNYRLPAKLPDLPPNQVVYWRGSNTHHEDLQAFAPAIIEAAQAHPDWTWTFQGMVPWFLHGKMPLEYRNAVSQLDYFRALRNEIKPAVMIVPLADHAFNRSKSNISWIEGTMVGAEVVCPSWLHPLGSGYTNVEEFAEILSDAILTPAPADIRLVPMLSFVNSQRRDLLESLL